MKTSPRVTLFLLLMGLAPSTAQAQQTLNYTTCIAQLDQIVAEVEGASQSGFFQPNVASTVPVEDIRPPQFHVQQNVADYSYTTTVVTSPASESQTSAAFPTWEFAIVRSGGAFSCAFRKTINVTTDGGDGTPSVEYAYSLPLSSVSEINRWHSAHVRTTGHLERLLAR